MAEESGIDKEIKREQIEEGKKKSNIKLVWGISIFLIVIFIIIMTIYKIANPNFSIWKIIIFTLILSIIIIPIAVGFNIYSRKKEQKESKKEEDEIKLPEPISTDKARLLADRLLLEIKYNYFKHKNIDGPANFGKTGRTAVYTCIGITDYKDEVQKDGKTWYAVLINLHYPDRNWIGEVTGINDKKINLEQNRLAIDPQDEPAIEETRTTNPLLGTETITKKMTPSQTKKEKKSQEKSEL